MQVQPRHVMVLDTATADVAWATPDVPAGIVLPVGPQTDLMRLLPSQRAAYPPGHPDHMPDDATLLGLLAVIVEGSLMGPLQPESAVVERGDEVVAGLLVSASEPERPWVADVWRHPAHPGLGTVLLRRAAALLHARGEPHLYLTVTEGNPAVARYESLGFRPESGLAGQPITAS